VRSHVLETPSKRTTMSVPALHIEESTKRNAVLEWPCNACLEAWVEGTNKESEWRTFIEYGFLDMQMLL
jgi:hypothetical protein